MKKNIILSDAGGILFSDTEKKHQEFDEVKKLCPELSFDVFYTGFRKYMDLAQTEKGYSRSDAFNEYFNVLRKQHDSLRNSEIPQFKNNKKKLQLNENVKETLEYLKNNEMKYIVMTDATKTSEKLLPIINQKMGLDGLIYDLISSKDVGAKKPSKEFFDYVLNKHNITKEQSYFLGHDFDELNGAYKIQIEPLALFFDKTIDLSFVKPQNFLYNFSDLKNLIKNN